MLNATLILQLAPDTARHFATGEPAAPGSRHEVHLREACRRAERGQTTRVNATFWDLDISRRATEALIENPTQDRSSVHHHELVKACRALEREAEGLPPVNDNSPCQICHRAYAHQFFMEGIWAHDGCLDDYYDRTA